ncbi:MAG: SAM-dependent methyltransferase [Kiritimatiellia bacterium]
MPSSALYRDPRLYDLEYADKSEDVVYYAKLASQAKGPVLELACGNGRITFPIARTGAHVTGIDSEQAMLDSMASKLQLETPSVQRRVQFRRGDMRELTESPVYDLVILPFNAIHHCRDHRDFLAIFDGARRALRPGGHFAMDCYLPDPLLYERDPSRRYEERHFIDPRSGGPLTSWEMGSYDPLTQVHQVVYIYRDHAGVETQATLNLRMFYPQELYALIDWAGFDVVHQWSEFDGSPVEPRSLKLVALLRPR